MDVGHVVPYYRNKKHLGVWRVCGKCNITMPSTGWSKHWKRKDHKDVPIHDRTGWVEVIRLDTGELTTMQWDDSPSATIRLRMKAKKEKEQMLQGMVKDMPDVTTMEQECKIETDRAEEAEKELEILRK